MKINNRQKGGDGSPAASSHPAVKLGVVMTTLGRRDYALQLVSRQRTYRVANTATPGLQNLSMRFENCITESHRDYDHSSSRTYTPETTELAHFHLNTLTCFHHNFMLLKRSLNWVRVIEYLVIPSIDLPLVSTTVKYITASCTK